MPTDEPSAERAREIDRLEDELHRVENLFGRGSFHDGLARERADKLKTRIAALRTATAAPEEEWWPVDLAPEGTWLRTRRDGEDGENVCAKRTLPGGELEWVEQPPHGRTTVTHHSFAAPTHWRPLERYAVQWRIAEQRDLKNTGTTCPRCFRVPKDKFDCAKSHCPYDFGAAPQRGTDDVSSEAIARVQAAADPILSREDWQTVDPPAEQRGLPVEASAEVSRVQAERIAEAVKPEFATGDWCDVEREKLANAYEQTRNAIVSTRCAIAISMGAVKLTSEIGR